MTTTRRLILLACLLGVGGMSSACTPEQVSAYLRQEQLRLYEERTLCAFYTDPRGANLDFVPGSPDIDCSDYAP